MYSSTPILVLLVMQVLFACDQPKYNDAALRSPQEEPSQEKRGKWFELMHRSHPNTNWRKIEYQNQRLLQLPSSTSLRNNCGFRQFANSQFSGRWIERGSSNQAGSILDITYFESTDQIWAIADGGSLWKRSRNYNDWEVINQDLRLNRGLLQFIDHQNQPRLLAFINNWLHYSDDFGITWTGTNASNTVENYYGYFRHPIVTNGPKSRIIFLSKPSYWSDLQLVYSDDDGEHLQNISILDDHDPNNFDLVSMPDTDEVWLLKRSAIGRLEIYQVDFENKRLLLLNPDPKLDAGQGEMEAQFGLRSDSLALYTYLNDPLSNETYYYYTTTGGQTWKKLANLPIQPWTSTLYISTQDPTVQYIGAVDAYKSIDGGESWEAINYWWEYYDDINHSLHADIMDVQEFKTSQGEYFTLISNHGGLNISYDQFNQMENLGLYDLHVSQYYSVRTNPNDPNMIYAGSQDQGLQAAIDIQSDSIIAFHQLIGGDYGHLSFTADGQSLWAVYPGGLIFFVEDVQSGMITASYELNSEDETVWLPPLHSGISLSEKTAFLAGGNPAGGPGSYLISLKFEEGIIQATRGEFDFLSEAVDGTISAIEMAAVDSNYQYVATTNGRFFYSHDGGNHWTQSLEFLPQGNYLYGQTILASAKNPKSVYLAGSGYSNPAVLFSDDGGKTFVEKSNGLPNTLVYDLALNHDESLLFAATEAGPFVFVAEQATWYYLGNACTPNQTFWSVEYIPDLERVRFGTYGRGIWDLELRSNPPTAVTTPPQLAPTVTIFPNPAHDFLHIEVIKPEEEYQIFNTKGQIVKRGKLQDKITSISVENWLPGTYYFQLSSPVPFTQKIIVY